MPVFSVNTDEEAQALIVAACPRDIETGEHYARELVVEQTLENLWKFGDRLRDYYALIRKSRSRKGAVR